jgi:hypothetical protein
MTPTRSKSIAGVQKAVENRASMYRTHENTSTLPFFTTLLNVNL